MNNNNNEINNLIEQMNKLQQAILSLKETNINNNNIPDTTVDNNSNNIPMMSIGTTDGNYKGVNEWRMKNINYAREYDRLNHQNQKIDKELNSLRQKYGIIQRSPPRPQKRNNRKSNMSR